ncbi:MAG: hypothetical protein ACYTBJ_04640 [Planctomycetota bacterium]|jgi:hypothetical protein
MAELVAQIDDETGEPLIKKQASLSEFCYENGYVFRGTDLGGLGVKIELGHEDESSVAIILPPGKAQECAQWLLRTLGQVYHSLPEDLPDILQKIVAQKEMERILERGDKRKIKAAVRALKD